MPKTLIPKKAKPAITIKASPIKIIKFFAVPLKAISKTPIISKSSGDIVNNCDSQLLAVEVAVVVTE